jgi:hypothetical protein
MGRHVTTYLAKRKRMHFRMFGCGELRGFVASTGHRVGQKLCPNLDVTGMLTVCLAFKLRRDSSSFLYM